MVMKSITEKLAANRAWHPDLPMDIEEPMRT
jgi:hypothetical protein